MKRIITAFIVGLIIAALGVYLTRPRGVMPLDAVTLEKYQLANSRIFEELGKNEPDLSYTERTAKSVRGAIRSLGYDPATTFAHWQSPAFRTTNATSNLRLADSILTTGVSP